MQFCRTWCWGKTEMTCVTYWLAECLWTGQQKTAWLNDWMTCSSDWFFELALLWASLPIESTTSSSPWRPWGLQHVRTKQRFTHFLLLPLKKSQYLVLSGRRKSAKARKVSQTKARFHVDLLTQLLVAIDLRGELVTCFDLVNSMKVDWWHFSSFFHWFLPLWVKLLSTTTGSLGKKTPLTFLAEGQSGFRLLELFRGYTWPWPEA